jgi:hypothetical protein
MQDEPRTTGVGHDLLTAYLADRDEACPRCGYNLRLLRSSRCPECGDEVRLQVGLVEPRVGAYIALVAAWSTGLGGTVLFGLIALTAAAPVWWRSEPCAWILIGTLVASAVWLPLVVRCRRRIRVRSPRFQFRLALASWGVTLLLFAAMVATFDD